MEIDFRQVRPKRVLVHCGLTKAGSTALQMQLFENRELLLGAGFYVPKSGVHFDNRMPGIHRTDGHGFIFSPNGSERVWAELKRELSALGRQEYTLVLSCENMTQADLENYEAICDRFLGCPVEFHFLIREFPYWLSSQVSEYAIGGNTRLVANDHRLLDTSRYGILRMLERMVELEQSGLNVCFHSYEKLKGDDIAFNFLRQASKEPGTLDKITQAGTPARQQNNLAHNNRFVLLAMHINQRTSSLSFPEYQAVYSGFIQLASQPFYRVGKDQTCVLSGGFLHELNQSISESLGDQMQDSAPLALLFPEGVPSVPAPAQFELGELVKIQEDLGKILPGTPVARRNVSKRVPNPRLPEFKSHIKRLFWRTSRSAVSVLRRTRRGTRLVLWLREFEWLSRLYGR